MAILNFNGAACTIGGVGFRHVQTLQAHRHTHDSNNYIYIERDGYRKRERETSVSSCIYMHGEQLNIVK